MKLYKQPALGMRNLSETLQPALGTDLKMRNLSGTLQSAWNRPQNEEPFWNFTVCFRNRPQNAEPFWNFTVCFRYRPQSGFFTINQSIQQSICYTVTGAPLHTEHPNCPFLPTIYAELWLHAGALPPDPTEAPRPPGLPPGSLFSLWRTVHCIPKACQVQCIVFRQRMSHFPYDRW